MRLVSDHILSDTPKPDPTHQEVFPRLSGFELWNPSAWTSGQPYDFFAKMRDHAPVMWSPMGKASSGFWSVSRYDTIKEVELKPDVFSSERGSINLSVTPPEKWRPKKLVPAALNALINLDEPRHMELKLQQKDFFIPRYVAELRERVGRKIDSLLDELEAKGPVVDFVKLFSQELPLYTLCEMLGVDEEDRPKIIRWMHYLELASQYLSNRWAVIAQEPLFPFKFYKNVNEMFAYGERVMADRRVNPRADLLTAIAKSKLEGEELSQPFLDGSWLLIIFAGNDTSRNSLTGTIQLLTEFPEQRALVLEDPALVPAMTDEALRLVSPVKHMRRTATEDTELLGQRIAKDEKVVLWYGAGNRDPDVFPDPNRFDLTRENVAKHIAFGHGIHKCLGSRIAQMQLRLSYEKILERFPKIAWTGKQTIAPNALVHAISSSMVNLYGLGADAPTRMQVKLPQSA